MMLAQETDDIAWSINNGCEEIGDISTEEADVQSLRVDYRGKQASKKNRLAIVPQEAQFCLDNGRVGKTAKTT